MSGGMNSDYTVEVPEDLLARLAQDQEDGLARGITMLSSFTFDGFDMVTRGVTNAISIGTAAGDFAKGGSDDTVGSLIGDQAESKITKLLGKAWDKARGKLEKNEKLKKACTLLEIGLNTLLGQIKGLIFNGGVLSKLVPFYGNVKGIIDGAIEAVAAKGHHTAMDTLASMGDKIASGIPSEALAGFKTYVQGETVRTGVKSAWTFAKSIGGLLAEIFSFGAWTVVSFATAVVEAVVSFVNSLVQGVLFREATEKFRDYAEARTLPTPEEFRTILAGCSFVGCVFFAGANYIGQFHLTSLLANENKVLTSKSLSDGLRSVAEVQRMACAYVTSAAFKVTVRPGCEDMQWLIGTMEKFGEPKPAPALMESHKSRWQRFKHRVKRLGKKKKAR